MANTDYTKVNIQQLSELASTIQTSSSSIQSGLTNYNNLLKSLQTSGYLEGVSVEAINQSYSKIMNTYEKFAEYASNVVKQLNSIAQETQNIEQTQSSAWQDIIGSNPIDFEQLAGAASSILGAAGSAIGSAAGGIGSGVGDAASGIGSGIGAAAEGLSSIGAEGETTIGEDITETTEITDTNETNESLDMIDGSNITPTPSTSTIERTTSVAYGGELSDNQIQTRDEMVSYAKNEMGLNDAATAALLANADQECTFTTTSSYTESNGSASYGLAQWNGSRRTALVNYCNQNGYDYTTTEGQMRFMEYELETSYPGVYEKLQTVENTPDGAYEAAAYFCKKYEVPANASTRADERGTYAMNYYSELTS